jgi:hypothetical protein
MKRRMFLALPAVAPLPAAAFRIEELPAGIAADLKDRCPQPGAHDDLARQGAASCPFCQCRIIWVPPSAAQR